MAPGILADSPVGESEIKIEVISINGRKVDIAALKAKAKNDIQASKDALQVAEVSDDASDSQDSTADESAAETSSDATEETGSSEPEDQTMKCEIKHLDRRIGSDDEYYYCERKQEVKKPKQLDWWRLYAFCVVRNYSSDDDCDSTELYINPRPLRQLIYDFLGKYPGDPVNLEDQRIEYPYRPLFHYRKEIEEEGTKRFANDPESLEQLQLLLGWIRNHFADDIAAYERCLSQKVIAYDRLWTLFKPDTVVHCKLLGQNRAFRISGSGYNECIDSSFFSMSASFVDFDGERIGTRNIDLTIPKYQGTLELHELPAVPLHLLEDADDVRKELVARGRKFEKLVGQHFMRYNGVAVKKTHNGYARFSVNGRVMIDCKTSFRLEPNDVFTCTHLDAEKAKMERSLRRSQAKFDFEGAPVTQPALTDDQAMLTNATVRGYSFTVKMFLEFFVDDLEEIEWNARCFDDLVLDPAVKKTVQALVSIHSKKRETMDDIVKGKGMGLVCVLHGPPGVGKTLTAECVAEYVKRPLYMVSSGDRKFFLPYPS
jgi:hypothetical protein